MDHAKKLDFILKMAKHGLDSVQHLDAGGTVLGGPTTLGAQPNTTQGGLYNALGLNNTYQAGSSPIQQGTNVAQLNQAYTGNQNALTGQQNLANTFAPGAQQAANQQAALSQQLAQQSQGQGPNPAQAQLAQATGANVANQAALMAGQRGASNNVGLMARQAAQQGAGVQQQAAGQAATLGAQQQLAAQQAQMQLAAQQAGQATGSANSATSGQQGEQQILQNANSAANTANVQMQSNINDNNARVAAANASGNKGMMGGIMGAVSSLAPIALGALTGGGSLAAGALMGGGGLGSLMGGAVPGLEQTQSDSFYGSPATEAAYNQQQATAQDINANDPYLQAAMNPQAGSRTGAVPQMAKGGEVQHYDGGGQVAPPDPQKAKDMAAGASKGGSLSDMWDGITNPKWANGGQVGAMPQSLVSSYFDDNSSKAPAPMPTAMAQGGMTCAHCGGLMESGGKVAAKNPKQKAVKKGNSYDNDKVPAMLSQGEIVLPRSVTQSSDPVSNAAKFVQATLAKKGLKKGLK